MRDFKGKLTHLKRRLTVAWYGLNAARRDQRISKPKMTETESQAARIWQKVVHQKESDLMYNPQTHEAYAQWDSANGTIYLFLESGNLRVINTVVGYDIRLSSHVEQYCANIFTREVAKRRAKFRKNAESKVTHSLDSLETRLNQL
jgi:hypothetical protein